MVFLFTTICDLVPKIVIPLSKTISFAKYTSVILLFASKTLFNSAEVSTATVLSLILITPFVFNILYLFHFNAIFSKCFINLKSPTSNEVELLYNVL